MVTYDIWCQFIVNLSARLQNEFPDEPDVLKFIDKIEGGIPQCHIQGHLSKCMCLYSLNTTQAVGRSNGETIEQSWAESKLTGGSTKHMNDGHRHDKLDTFHNDWNFRKQKNTGHL